MKLKKKKKNARLDKDRLGHLKRYYQKKAETANKISEESVYKTPVQ